MRLLFARIICCVLTISVSACTSLQTYGLDQIDSNIPLAAGDEITIYLNDVNFTETSIVVNEITEDSISGTPVSSPGMEVIIPLDDIARVETRQFSIAKTTGLVLLSAFFIAAADGLGDMIDDLTGD